MWNMRGLLALLPSGITELLQRVPPEILNRMTELRLRADLRRNFFPPPDRGRRRDGGVVQGARYHHIWRERRGKAVSVDNFCP
jgi:hypothetical protein